MLTSSSSLGLRLFISASIILAAFMSLAGIVLEHAFKEGAVQAQNERLQVHIYALLSAADINQQGQLKLPAMLPEARFSNPGSGLYGFVFNQAGEAIWRSASAVGVTIPAETRLQPGETMAVSSNQRNMILYYAIVWETEKGEEYEYIFAVAEESDALMRQVSSFSHILWSWLGGIGVLLIVVQLLVLAWSLKPLRMISREVEAIETGEKHGLDGSYPRELQGLANNINGLLESERKHLERYRNTLADLAHSLKTPLAILTGITESGAPGKQQETSRAVIDEQVRRMNDLVEYQLQRAAARGKQRMSTSIEVSPVLQKIFSALDKVYARKGVRATLDGDSKGRYFGEEGDIYEIAGNLIDNAYKWCDSRVDVSLFMQSSPGRKSPGIRLIVEDDGPGIDPDQKDQILGRGARADERTEGHGIGMAIVNELVELYGGDLILGISRYGGTRWEVWLPSPV